MSNNCIDTVLATVPAAATSILLTMGPQNFKNIKWIVNLQEATTDRAHAYEVTASYTLANPPVPMFSRYAIMGNNIDHTLDIVYNQTSMLFELTITNNEAVAIDIHVGELERIE